MVKIDSQTLEDMDNPQPSQRKTAEKLCYIPYGKDGKWAIPLTKDDGQFAPALADWDSSSLNPEGDMVNEKFGGVIVVVKDELNPKRSENVSGLLNSSDQSFIAKCINIHGISYPVGTLDQDKI